MAKTTVLVDGMAFENPSQIGIWRVFYEVMRRTSKTVNYVLLLQDRPVHAIPDNVSVRAWHHHNPDTASRHPWRVCRRARAIRRLEREFPKAIWHSTYFTVDPRSEPASVVTVFDCVSERFFHLDSALTEQTRLKEQCLNQADIILAISKSTAADLVAFYPSLRFPVTVTRLGADHFLPPQNLHSQDAVRDRSPYCLYVGSRNAYKNFYTLVDALSEPAWPSHVELKVVGRPFSDDEIKLLRYKAAESRITHAGFVSDDALRDLYSASLCFVFPSLAEGFGLPLVESQVSGTVPVVSDIPVFREVADDGAVFFDPTSPRSIAEAVNQVLDPDHASEIRSNAARQVRTLSWEETAEKTLEAYSRMVDSR